MRPQLFALGLLLLFSGCTTPSVPGDDDEERPNGSPSHNEDYKIGWQTGDYWVQRAYYEDKPDETLQTMDYYVEAPETVNGVQTVRIVSSDAQRAMWIRTDDGALVKETVAGTEKTYDPPCKNFVGLMTASVDHPCHRIGTRPGMNASATDSALSTKPNGTRNMSVPAGSFDVTQLETTMDGKTFAREFYSVRACFPVRVITTDGQRTVFLDLVTYQCAKPST